MEEREIPHISLNAQLQPKAEWYTPLTRVTPLSKALAMVLFVALPFVGFWLGWQYGGCLAEICSEHGVCTPRGDCDSYAPTQPTSPRIEQNFSFLWSELDPEPHELFTQGLNLTLVSSSSLLQGLSLGERSSYEVYGNEWDSGVLATSTETQDAVRTVLQRIYSWGVERPAQYHGLPVYGYSSTGPNGETLTYCRIDQDILRVIVVRLHHDNNNTVTRMSLFFSKPLPAAQVFGELKKPANNSEAYRRVQ